MSYPTDKDQRIVTLKAQGATFDQIAAVEGYSSRQAAQQAHARAIKKFPSPNVDEVRAESDALDDYLRQILMDRIRDPGNKTSAIGRNVYTPGTCTCGIGDVQDSREVQHAPDCKRVPAIDTVAQLKAVSELRKLNGERVKLHGAAKKQPMTVDEAMLQVKMFLATLPPPTYTAEILSVTPETPGEPSGDETSIPRE